jgi:hypothetical protein
MAGDAEATKALRNYEDTAVLPICVVCGRVIRLDDEVARPNGSVHARCLSKALEKSAPSEPKL